MSMRFFSGGQSTYSTRPEPATSTRSAVRSRWLMGWSPPILNTSPLHASFAAARRNELHGRIGIATRREDRQLTAAVDFEVRVRIAHAVDVAHLAGEVEDHRAVADQVVHRRLLAHVGDVHAQSIGEAVDVEQVA